MLAVCVTASANELSKLLEETTEIATKTRINADYVPGTVNIIRGEELKALGILNLNQPNALDMIVGMDSSVNALRGSGAVYGGQGVKIKWLLNGRTINSQIWSGSIWGKGIISFPILVDQIDRIEIIRGPDLAIYGDNAIFGVINIITKSTSNDMALSGSYQGDGKTGSYVAANTAYEKDDLLFNASVSAYQNDGYGLYVGKTGNFYSWVNGAQAPGYGPGNLQNNSGGYTVFLDLSYKDNRFWANRMRSDSAQGAFGTWYPTDPLPKDDGKLNKKVVFEQFGYGRFFDAGFADIDFKIGYDTSENSFDNFLRLGKDFNNVGFDSIRSISYKEDRKYASIDLDKRYGSHHVISGVSVQKTTNVEDKRYQNFSINWGVPTTVFQTYGYVGTAVTDENTDRWQRSFFFQDSWDVTEKATVTYGARYDKFQGDIKSNGWSPRVALVYRASENNILKVQYARAFRPPTFAEIADKITTIKSETVDTLEIGHIYKKDNITLKNTLFESRIYDMITFDDLSYYTINLPNMGKIQGFEMEGKYSADSYEIGLNQAFYKTDRDERKFLSPDNADTYTYKSGSFPLAPTYMANIFVKLNQNGTYPTTIWYHYIGAKKRKSEFEVANAFDAPKGASNGSVPPQYYLNITQQFKGIAKDLDLSVGVQNLLGKTLKTLYMPLNQPNNQDIPYMGQMFWMNLSYKF